MIVAYERFDVLAHGVPMEPKHKVLKPVKCRSALIKSTLSGTIVVIDLSDLSLLFVRQRGHGVFMMIGKLY